MRSSRISLIAATIFAASICWPLPAAADNVVTKAGSAVGGFFKRLGRVFRGEPPDPNLVAALEKYEKGDYFTTYLYAARLYRAKTERLSDEAVLLLGLSAAEADLRGPAVAALRLVLESDPTSPYYPVALAAWLDLEARLGNTKEAGAAAAKYLADLWQRPKSLHDADVKAVFLESGNISPLTHPRYEKLTREQRDERFSDRPGDRAMYLAGTALLAVKDFEKAEICLEALDPRSAYFPYARYALGQTYYGLGRVADAKEALTQVQPQPGRAETYLRDRALLIGAELLHQADENSAAIDWLRHIDRQGPFGLHAALLAAEIQAEQEKPALALVYLQERPEKPVEPKLAARAAALDAELHRQMNDTNTAVTLLEQGIKGLQSYATKLRVVSGESGELDKLLRPLDVRQQAREGIADWRRQNVSFAVPDLLDGRQKPGWPARLFTRMVAGKPEIDGYPIIYYPKPYDPFVALSRPKDLPFEPPSDTAFPTIFRRSLSQALNDALHHEKQLRRALETSDDTHLSLLLLSGAMRLRAKASGGDAAGEVKEIAELIALPPEVSAVIEEQTSGNEGIGKALKVLDPLPPDSSRHARLVEMGKSQLVLWRDYRRQLVREAVSAEQKAVDEIRFSLDFDLSQALGGKKEAEKKILEGS